MSQNKGLKRNMAELQDAYVKLSHQNMELASELETEKRRVAYLRAQLATPTPARETTPIPVIEVESTSVPPSHMAASNPIETTPTLAEQATPPPAMPTSPVKATPTMEAEARCDAAEDVSFTGEESDDEYDDEYDEEDQEDEEDEEDEEEGQGERKVRTTCRRNVVFYS